MSDGSDATSTMEAEIARYRLALEVTIREFFERIVDERDKQYDQRFRSAEIAIAAALAAQEKSVTAAFAASEKAIVKSEEMQKDYNQRSIELVETMRLFFSTALETQRLAFDKALENVVKEIASLRESRSQAGGEKVGSSAVWGYILGAVGALVGIISLAAYLFKP